MSKRKIPEKNNDLEINSSPDQESKVLVVKISLPIFWGKRIDVHNENCNKELENIKETQS